MRTIHGYVTVTIEGASGTQTPNVFGNMTAEEDETDFMLEHQVNGTGSGVTAYQTVAVFFFVDHFCGWLLGIYCCDNCSSFPIFVH